MCSTIKAGAHRANAGRTAARRGHLFGPRAKRETGDAIARRGCRLASVLVHTHGPVRADLRLRTIQQFTPKCFSYRLHSVDVLVGTRARSGMGNAFLVLLFSARHGRDPFSRAVLCAVQQVAYQLLYALSRPACPGDVDELKLAAAYSNDMSESAWDGQPGQRRARRNAVIVDNPFYCSSCGHQLPAQRITLITHGFHL